MNKQHLEIGESGKAWKPEHDEALKEAIKKIYGGHLPYSMTVSNVVKDILSLYNCERSEAALELHLRPYLNKIGNVFNQPKPITKEGIVYKTIREYSPVPVKKDYDFPPELINNEGKTLSRISLRKINENEKNILYIFPVVLDADYGEIFTTIFSEVSDNKKFNDDRYNHLYDIKFKEDYRIMVPLPRKGNFSLLATAPRYLLDLLFARLYGELARRSSTSSEKAEQINACKEIVEALDSFEKVGLKFSKKDELLRLIKDLDTPIGEGASLLIPQIKQIKDSMKDGYIKIPAYSIRTPKAFELYAFCKKHKEYSEWSVEFQKDFEKDSSPKNNTMKPDIVVYNKDQAIVFDAKYKFQYTEDSYCGVSDADQMTNYILYLRENRLGKKDDGAEKKGYDNPHGYFVSPTINPGLPGKDGTNIGKQYLFLPANKDFIW